ncbi:MAG: hypothetical protein ABI196_00620 [Bradyrhizobium sp.]
MTLPADIVNEALDQLGVNSTIGDLEEGSNEARSALRWYGPTLRRMLRKAPWNFARKQFSLTLLNDASGQTPNVGIGTPGMVPWCYEYAWPIDCVRALYVPMNGIRTGSAPSGNIAIPTTPLMPGLGTVPVGRVIPAPFVIAQDSMPILVGVQQNWADTPDYADVLGSAPNQQTVILTNVAQASLVYTALIIYPEQWDVLFRQAFVAALASSLALPCVADKKLALALRTQQVAIAKDALSEAMVANGNEEFYAIDHVPDWLRVRGWGFRHWNEGWRT